MPRSGEGDGRRMSLLALPGVSFNADMFADIFRYPCGIERRQASLVGNPGIGIWHRHGTIRLRRFRSRLVDPRKLKPRHQLSGGAPKAPAPAPARFAGFFYARRLKRKSPDRVSSVRALRKRHVTLRSSARVTARGYQSVIGAEQRSAQDANGNPGISAGVPSQHV